MSIVITGNPGVGKHTIAKEITRALNLPIVDINKIALEFGLFERKDETNDVDVFVLKKIIKEKKLEPAIFVGHLAPYVLSPEKIKKVLVLRKNPYELVKIYKERKYSKEKIKDNVGSEVLGIILHDAISKFGLEKTIQVDSSYQVIEETVKKVLGSISGQIKGEDVDWLTVISEKGDLKEFFAY